MVAKEAKDRVGCSGNHLGCPCGAGVGLQYGLSGNSVPDMVTYRLGFQRETARAATHGKPRGNPTEPQAVRFTLSAATLALQKTPDLQQIRCYYFSGEKSGGQASALPELPRAFSRPFAEALRKIARVVEADGQRDFRDGQLRAAQQVSALGQAVAVQIRDGRLRKKLLKQLAAFALADRTGAGDIAQRDFLRIRLLDDEIMSFMTARFGLASGVRAASRGRFS